MLPVLLWTVKVSDIEIADGPIIFLKPLHFRADFNNSACAIGDWYNVILYWKRVSSISNDKISIIQSCGVNLQQDLVRCYFWERF